MSELNKEFNDNKIEENEVKNRINVRTIIFLILFTAVAVGITFVAIHYTNNKKEIENISSLNNTENKEITGTQKDESYLSVDLLDTYDKNPVTVQEYYYLDGKVVSYEEANKDLNFDIEKYNKKGKYLEIEGLKDSKIQNKINKDIKENAMKIINDGKETITEIKANFGNVISVFIYSLDDDNIIGLNYKLEDGEKLKFEDLFTDKAYIKTILGQSAYKHFASLYIDSEKLGGNADEKDYSNAEQDSFKIVSRYLSDNDIDYYFTPTEITALIDGQRINIEMADFYNYIAIYKRYINVENLYDSESEFKNLFVFSDRRTDGCFYHKLQYETNNLFVDIWLYDFNDISDNRKKEAINNIEEILNKVKDEANSNKNREYIFTAFVDYYEDEVGNQDIYVCEMSKNYFETEGKEMIARCNREQGNNFQNLGVYYGEEDEKNISSKIYYKGEFLEPDAYYEKIREEDAE